MNKTYELKITPISKNNEVLKYKLIDKLHQLNVTSFVEDVVENLEEKTDNDCLQLFTKLEKDQGYFSSILVHSYDKNYLEKIDNQLKKTFHLNEIKITLTWVYTQSWKNTWKQNFKPLSVGDFLICPPWDVKQLQSQETIIIEPAMAFGTGQHETTYLCLEQLTNYFSRNQQLHHKSMLDVGTGSGILAIAGKKKGFSTVHALDIDQDAILATTSNATINNCTIQTYQHSLTSEFVQANHSKYDLITSNILYSTIVNLMPYLVQLMTRNSELILSGILSSQQKDLLQICKTYKLKLDKQKHMNDWSCLTLIFE